MNLKLLKENVGSEINQLKKQLRELSVRMPDSSDIGTAVEMQNSINNQLSHKERYYKRILKACKKQEDGDFGYCEDCGINIPEKRLSKMPDAECCVDCQSIREFKLKVA